MYFHVFGDRPILYQWDLNRRIVVDVACQEVHFSNTLDGEALVVDTYTEDGVTYANIPNVLLQTAFPVNVYAYVCGSEQFTRRAEVLEVMPRSKPADYVYTETEVKNYEALAARLDEIEKNGVSADQIKTAVDKYLEDNPVDAGVDFTPGNALELTDDGVLNVKTTNGAEPDNTLPITSAGVNTIVGNIGAILDTI